MTKSSCKYKLTIFNRKRQFVNGDVTFYLFPNIRLYKTTHTVYYGTLTMKGISIDLFLRTFTINLRIETIKESLISSIMDSPELKFIKSL